MTENFRKIEMLINAKETRLVGDLTVRRILPKRDLRRIGGFVFLDHFGKIKVKPKDFDVPPHPHVGLQTVTYLFSGELLHKDSLGSEQIIKPGDVNWMTAGKGITHSEQGTKFQEYHGIQSWVGLPQKFRKIEPKFEHFRQNILPVVKYKNTSIRVIAGEFGENVSPVSTFQRLTYLDVEITRKTKIDLPVNPKDELGIYVVEDQILIDGKTVKMGTLAKLSEGQNRILIESGSKARIIIFGGAPLPEPTVIHWNFITDTIEEAREHYTDWKKGKFPKVEGYFKN